MSFRSINRDVWTPLLKFNREFFKSQKKMPMEEIKSLSNTLIPFFPIQMNPYNYNRLLSAFGYIIHGENATFIEILHDSDKIIQLTFVRSDDEGNFIEVIEDVLPNLKLEFAQIANLESLFDIIKSEIVKLYNVDIGAIRLYHIDLIKAVTDFSLKVNEINDKSSKNLGYTDIIQTGLELLFNVLQNDWFMVYPDIPMFTFFKELIKKYPDIVNLLKDLKVPKGILSNNKLSITLRGENWYITLIIEILDDHIRIEARPPFEFGPVDNSKEYYWTDLMKSINEKYQTSEMGISPNYLIDANWIAEFLFEIFESKIPFDESRLKYLMQKLFFGYKKIENVWDVAPRPAVYNEMVRYIIRLMGYRINPRKLSYWSLPDLLMFTLVKNFGSNYRLTFLIGPENIEEYYGTNTHIVTDAYGKASKAKMSFPGKFILNPEQMPRFLKDTSGFIVQYRGSEVENFSYINKEEMEGLVASKVPILDEIIHESNIFNKKDASLKKKDTEADSRTKNVKVPRIQETPLFKAETTFKAYMKQIHSALSQKYGFINGIFFINTKLLAKLSETFLIDINTKKASKYLRFMKTFKCMKRVDCFYIYPEVPAYHYFRKTKISAYLKMIFRMMFDNREF
jgi:hypothetical protein